MTPEENTPPPAAWRNRVTGYGDVDPKELLANPKNWRIHPKAQQAALAAVLDKVGWVTAAAIVNRQTGFVVDGHLRVSIALARNEASIPVGYVDLTEDEENLILASFDSISGAAVTDTDKLTALLGGIEFVDPALDSLFANLMTEAEAITLSAVKAADTNSDTPEGKGTKNMGTKSAQIKPVLYSEQIAVFERSLRATGIGNRAEALIKVCQSYLDGPKT
jgi:hypothetical protein